MSQIRKLQGGGKPLNWGKLIIDGTTYDMNEEKVRQAFLNHLSTTSNTYGDYYSDVLDTLRSGTNVVGDSISNRFTSGITGFRVNTERENQKLNTYENTRQKRRDARKDNGVHNSKIAINNVLSFKMPKVTPEQDEINNDLKVFDYSTEGGFAKNSAVNEGILDRMNYYYDWFSDPGTWAYKWSSPHQGASEGDLRAWYKTLGEDYESRRNNLKQIVDEAIAKASAAKSWDDVDSDTKRILSYFNIGVPKASTSASSEDTDEDKIKAATIKKWQDAGYTTDKLYDTVGDLFELTDDGLLTLKPGVEFNLGDWHNGRNIYFNDDFYKSQYGKDHRLDALTGLTFYNGKLYQLGNQYLKDIVTGENGYNNLLRKGNWTGAQNEIMTTFSNGAQNDYVALGPEQYSEFFYQNPRYRFKNLTGQYDVTGQKLGKNERLVAYVDTNNPYAVEGSPYLDYEVKYAVLDDKGRWKRDVDVSEIQETGNAANDFDAYYDRVYGTGDEYEGMYRQEFIDSLGNPTEIWIYRNPDDPNRDVILHLPALKGSKVAQGGEIALPPELAEIVLNNPNFINRISQSKSLLERFIDLISRLNYSDFRDFWTRNESAELKGLRQMGFSQEEAERIRQIIKEKRSQSSSHDRVDEMVKYGPSVNRMGGKIDYIAKLAKGGVSGGSTKSTEKGKQDVVTKRAKNSGNAASLSEIGTDNWNSADTADLIALGADLAAAGVIFADPTNIAGAGAGVAASLSRFYADRTRHQLNPDAGKGAGWNLALNLGMDAVSLIPVVGDATQAARTANTIRKSLPTILKLVSVAGMGDAAATAAIKIANGDKWTVRDLSLVANAVTSGIALSKTGGFGKGTKSTKTKGYSSEKVKIGDASEKELGSRDIEDIVNSSNPRKILEEKLKSLFPEADDTAISSKASDMLTKKQNLWQRVRKKEGNEVLERSKTTTKSKNEVEANGNWFHDWWHGVGEKRVAHVSQLRGNGTPRKRVQSSDGVKYTRTDVAEAPGTTAGGKYYKDEFGTSYRKGDVTTEKISAEDLASVKRGIPENHRSAINDDAGNFTGKVKVEVVRQPVHDVPFETFKRGNWLIPNIMLFDHSRIGYKNESAPPLTYATSMKKGGIIKAQKGLGINYGLNTIELPYKINPVTGKPEPNIPPSGSTLQTPDNLLLPPVQPPNLPTTVTPPSGTLVPPTQGTGSTGQGSGTGGWWWDVVEPKYPRTINDAWLGGLEAATTIAGNNAGFRASTKHTLDVPMMPGYNPNLIPNTGSTALQHQQSWLQGLLTNGVKATSNNPITNAAIKQQRDSQIFQQMRENVAAQSQWEQQNTIQNLGIINQAKLAEQQRVGNWLQSKYYAQQAYDNANRANILGNTSVITNLMRENRLKLKQDRNLGVQAGQFKYSQALQRKYEDDLKKMFSDAWATWQTADQEEYSSFEEYVMKNYPEEYAPKREELQRKKRELEDLARDYGVRGRYNFPLLQYEKKGGRINGKTRYTLEPDERIWIENIKAQHKSVDKANEAAIKMLLKALK